MQNSKFHTPVLVEEVIKYLVTENVHLNSKAWIVDATLGTAGHAMEIIKKGVNVVGIEMDEDILKVAKDRLDEACPVPDKCGAHKVFHGNFKDMDSILEKGEVDRVFGVLIDLGVNNIQLTSGERGFSFANKKAELDMRIDKDSMGLKASDLLNALREDQLVEVFLQTMEFKEARLLAKKVIRGRGFKHYETVGDFSDTCESVVKRKGKLHPATRPFLALRMAVNSELENLEEVLPKAIKVLEKGGRLGVISFHSGEDKIVKNTFSRAKKLNEVKLVNNKPIEPSLDELNDNPRSRSARLRIVEKL